MVAIGAGALNFIAILTLAMLLDALLGEPRWLWSRFPHPAVLMGSLIGWSDKTFNKGKSKRLKGTACLLTWLAGAALCGVFLQSLGWFFEILVAAVLLSHRSLIDHVQAVADALRISLGDGRRSVAMIVGRDTKDMDSAAVSRAAIESAAENFSDGVIAPAFWFLVAGLPGLLIYKITNTADSMVGYQTERHGEFGWASARFDDLLNLIPARVTALLFAITQRRMGVWREISDDAALHRSPNAGWPEAALSRGLGVALAGPRSYDGKASDFPFVNVSGRKSIGPNEIEQACTALWFGWFAVVACLCVVWLAF